MAVIVVVGLFVGVTTFYGYQVNAALGAVATESFDPAAARAAIPNLSDRHIVFVEPTPYPDEEIDVLTLQRKLASAFDISKPFDPNEFSPYSFGEPIADELYDSYLLVGTDASQYLADAVVLALQPTDGSRPIMVSLPRDLYVWNVCKNTFTRLNAGLGGCSGVASGLEMLAILVEDYTGISIDHVARINFSGFKKVVDAMGGITICVDYPTRDLKSGLLIEEAGCNTADGVTALAWVRSRKTEQLKDGQWVSIGSSDFSRQARQQDVLFQLAAKAAGFSSPTTLVTTLSAVTSSVKLDSSWSFVSAVTTAYRYRGLSQSSVTRFTIGVRNYRTPGGASVLLPTSYFASYLP